MNNHTDMKERILAAIEEQKVSMRPKVHFTLKLAAVAAAVVAVFLLTVGIANFMLFSIRINSTDALLGFGPRGWGAFFYNFPWTLFVFDVGAIALLQHLLREFRFGYKTPIIWLVLGVAVISAGLGFAIDRGTLLNDRMLERAQERGLPPGMNAMYQGVRRDPHDVRAPRMLIVTDIQEESFVGLDPRTGSSTVMVHVSPHTTHATTSGLVVGETVIVAGDVQEDGSIRAFGVRPAPERGQ